MKKNKKRKQKINPEFKKEFLFTFPTFLNALRIVLTFVIVYMIISDKSIVRIVSVFIIAALTDWFDGRIARKYKLVNPFGAKADMLADRILWVGVGITIFIHYGQQGFFSGVHLMEIFFIFPREIIAFPFALAYLFFGKRVFPSARYIAKFTTFMQGFAIPSLLLSFYYPIWNYPTLIFSIIILITGSISGILYVKDLRELNE